MVRTCKLCGATGEEKTLTKQHTEGQAYGGTKKITICSEAHHQILNPSLEKIQRWVVNGTSTPPTIVIENTSFAVHTGSLTGSSYTLPLKDGEYLFGTIITNQDLKNQDYKVEYITSGAIGLVIFRQPPINAGSYLYYTFLVGREYIKRIDLGD